MDYFSFDIDDRHLKTERNKARQLRATQWWKRQLAKGVCHYCGKTELPARLTMDHIVPISRGGRSTRGNVAPACKTCNNKKKYLLPMEWNEYLASMRKQSNEETRKKNDPE